MFAGCISDRLGVSPRVPVQASQSVLQNQDLPPQHWREGPGVPPHRGRRELEPATKTEQVIQALVSLVNDPEPDHPLRADLAGDKSFL